MAAADAQYLRKAIHGEEWVKGAVNYDEDLHFSTFYLRASCWGGTRGLYPGYSQLLAFYEDFNEHYFLLKRECTATAAAIVRRALRQPRWLGHILDEIERRSDALATIFPPATSPATLAALSNAGVLAYYRRHARTHRALYKYARLPEALDRGVAYFSSYLQTHLRNAGLTDEACADAFAVLSQPVAPSILAEEIMGFDRIVQAAWAQPDAFAHVRAHPARARMFLAPELLRQLNSHKERWQHLAYHGYGRRELTTLDQYVARLVKQGTAAEPASAATIGDRCAEAQRARQAMVRKLRLDPGHRALFEIYPRIGAVKLYRRMAQLRNFYYLDMLLADIARRIGETEWTIRCMLPEEVEASLRAGKLTSARAHDRLPHCLYALRSGTETIFTGSVAKDLHGLLLAKSASPPQKGALRGVVACQGKAIGPCKVIIRADDQHQKFVPGTIIVSESTDPDLLGLLRQAGGVLTEQGGVTSHAAIICRELGIPTIIGIDGLLARVRDGDVLDVDAHRGVVTVVPEKSQSTTRATLPAPAELSPEVIGAKAYNLGVVRSMGFPVPAYLVLDYAGVRSCVQQGLNGQTKRVIGQAVAQIGVPTGGKLALRSSAVNEDRDTGSRAGDFRSILNIDRDQVAPALRDFIHNNEVGKSGVSYRGSIIVQRMIAADCAGVCLTLDNRTGTRNTVIIEMTAGSNEGITNGTGSHDRVIVDRLTGDILDESRRAAPLGRTGLDLGQLVQQFLTLEARFGRPLDIEWAIAERQLYILQVRPIVINN